MKKFLITAAATFAALAGSVALSSLANAAGAAMETTVCVSDSDNEHRCPINANWINCSADAAAKEKIYQAISSATKEGKKISLPYVVTDLGQGGGGPCGWHQLKLTAFFVD